MNKIYYLAPSSDRPSWGLGIIYGHVEMLVKNGFNAVIIKEGDKSIPSWLMSNVTIKDFNTFITEMQRDDILVVPEVMVNTPGLKDLACRKFLFLQNIGYLFESMPSGTDHQILGFEHVLIIMPHMQNIVSQHIKLPYTLIPPFVADYFFTESVVKRMKQIILYPKNYQIDYTIVKYIIDRHIKARKKSFITNILHNDSWDIIELKGLSHQEVSKMMKKSTFFISLNTFEALNTSITESMASGCIVFCYEGVGPKDYLLNNINAKVFANNEAYALAESVCNQIDQFDHQELELNVIRQNAYETAKKYTRLKTEESLLDFYQNL